MARLLDEELATANTTEGEDKNHLVESEKQDEHFAPLSSYLKANNIHFKCVTRKHFISSQCLKNRQLNEQVVMIYSLALRFKPL